MSGEEMVTVKFFLSIGLVGCQQEREEEIPASDIPTDPDARSKFFYDYAEGVFNGEVEMWWKIEGEDA